METKGQVAFKDIFLIEELTKLGSHNQGLWTNSSF